MTNPWEETWAPERFLSKGTDDEDQRRARLASAAPEMARLLMEFAYLDGDCDVCAWCADDEVTRGQHSNDCRLVAALRKAGVLP